MGLGSMQDFMDYMGYRNMVLEDRVQACMDAIERGETEIQIDCTDLTTDEQERFQEKLQRRINGL